jgi:long-subunit fatty acid transport protein
MIALSVCVCTYGQSEVEAYRFSKNDLSGTARGQAMGGAFGALGGDATGVVINPAGIGIYKKSEIVLNTALTFNTVNADWKGYTDNASKTSLTVDNLSYVGIHSLDEAGNNLLNFGFNFNRIKNFNRSYSVTGKGMESSLADYMAEITGGTAMSSYEDPNSPRWLGILGFDGYLINELSKTTYVRSDQLQGNPDPSLSVNEKGNISSYDFTLGISASDKFYAGLTLAVTDITYSLSGGSMYKETFQNGVGFNLQNYLTSEGDGYQVKAGIIYRLIDEICLGVSYHSPTWYSMSDYYEAFLTSQKIHQKDGTLAGMSSTPQGARYDYKFRTPGLWTFSAAAILGRSANISVDYELKNYGSARFAEESFSNADDYVDNRFIKEDYKQISTLRAGLEYRFTPRVAGRLGYAWMQSPYVEEISSGEREVVTTGTTPHYSIEGDIHHLTAGLGYKFTPQFYIDLAFVYRMQNDDFYFYSPIFSKTHETLVASHPATLKNNSAKVLMTLGYKF